MVFLENCMSQTNFQLEPMQRNYLYGVYRQTRNYRNNVEGGIFPVDKSHYSLLSKESRKKKFFSKWPGH